MYSVDWKERKILSGWQERLDVAFQVASDVCLAYSREMGTGFWQKRRRVEYSKVFSVIRGRKLDQSMQYHKARRSGRWTWKVRVRQYVKGLKCLGEEFIFNCANTGNSIEQGIILNLYITPNSFASISHWILSIALYILAPWPVRKLLKNKTHMFIIFTF